MKKYKVLFLNDMDYGRDVEIMMPVIYYAERFLNCEVIFDHVWDTHAVYKHKPDLLLMANTVGSQFHFDAPKYAYMQGIPTFSLISEGNFKVDNTWDVWGFNVDKNFYEDFICLWSKRTQEYYKKILPEISERFVVTGATGFDRYKIYHFNTKEEYLKRKNLAKYKKAIGYAGWGFGRLHNEQGRGELAFYFGVKEDHMQWLVEQMYLVEDILKKSIENNPDILFIFKKHPNEENPTITKEALNEMNRLTSYPNVLYIKDKEDVHDVISATDFWTAFESTTTLESWLMRENPTVLINPDPNFNRDKLHLGSVIVSDYESFQQCIDEYFSTKDIKAFHSEDKKQARIDLIEDSIGFADGYNHLRASYYLTQVLEKIEPGFEKKMKFNVKYFLRHLFLVVFKKFYNENIFLKVPKLNKHNYVFKILGFKNVYRLKEQYRHYFDSFYTEQKLNEKLKDKDFLKHLIEKM